MGLLSLLSYHNYLGSKEKDELDCRRHLFAAVTSCGAYHDSQFLFLLSLMWCAASNYHFDKEATETIIKQEVNTSIDIPDCCWTSFCLLSYFFIA